MIKELHEAYRSGARLPSTVIAESLSLAKANRQNEYLFICESRAQRQADDANLRLRKEGDQIFATQSLFGVPVAIKDNLVLDGVRTTAGSKILENYVPPYTATAVSRLEAAGAIVVGKTNLDEFGMGSSSENSAFGPVSHPTHADRVAGGSSGGSAVAVRNGSCLAALGSDTGGSVRLPAHYTGVFGMKPTYGRASRLGLIAYASSLDQVGAFAHSADDLSRVFSVILAHDPKDSTSALDAAWRPDAYRDASERKTPLRIGVPRECREAELAGALHPAQARAFREALAQAEASGAVMEEVSLPQLKLSLPVYYLIAMSEAASNLARFDGIRFGDRTAAANVASNLDAFYEEVRSLFGAEVKRRILLGTFALSQGYADEYYLKACRVRRLIQRDFETAFKQVDLIVTPVSSGPAFKKGEKVTSPLQMYLNDVFTVPANLVGLPAISAPSGATVSQSEAKAPDEVGLPLGIQWIAPAHQDEALLAAMRTLRFQERA